MIKTLPTTGYSTAFGLGAGFYLNAILAHRNRHYQMYDYVTKELPALVEANFPVTIVRSISGHSMGGHGALTIALKCPEQYLSVSAFSPTCAPMDCPWWLKAFSGYLGEEKAQWEQYDASKLMKEAKQTVPAPMDQGTSDGFLKEQLRPEALELAAEISGYPLDPRRQEGYDHSYCFIASFIGDHRRFPMPGIWALVHSPFPALKFFFIN